MINVDTDKIIPKQFLKTIERKGLAKGLFDEMRHKPDGSENPDFVLNKPAYRQAKILVAGENFGCGSSREHAPWGLQDYGFDVVIAPSFGDIFRQNSVQIGLVPIVLPADEVKRLMAYEGRELTVDLESRTIVDPDGGSVAFPFDEHERHRLLNGLDDIGLTLSHEAEIAAFEAGRADPISTVAA
jgi:3-isopropylmalate/(R)-2-methylmalate dehydratase small subunit